jgi:hypothetical protein
MRMQREIDMARMARDQYHAARDDLWRENEKLRAELSKLRQGGGHVPQHQQQQQQQQQQMSPQSQSQKAALDLATRSKSERRINNGDRAAERAREANSTLRLSRKSSGGPAGGAKESTAGAGGGGKKDKEYIELQTSGGANELYAGIGDAVAGMADANGIERGGDRDRDRDRGGGGGGPRDQYQAIDAAIADADLSSPRSNEFPPAAIPPPPSPSKPARTINGSLGPPPPPGAPPRANMVASNDVATWPNVDPARDPNYASLPVTSKAVPNAVAGGGGGGETYGDVPQPNW